MTKNKMPEPPESREFLLDTVLYRSFVLDDQKIDRLEKFTDTLDMYCPECKENSTFRPITQHIEPLSTIPPIPIPARVNRPRTLSIEFVCARNPNHRATFVFRIGDNLISKIGEYPSAADRQYPEIKKYENELGDYYGELKTAALLQCHNIGIGSFVYLRRVLEKVVCDVAVRKYSSQQNWTLEKWRESKKRFDEMIEDLKDDLPEFLVRNPKLYDILSKGVHELSEKECLECYQVVKAAIEEVLDDKMNRDEKEKRQNLISGKVAQVYSDLKHKNQSQDST